MKAAIAKGAIFDGDLRHIRFLEWVAPGRAAVEVKIHVLDVCETGFRSSD
jgi:hypothetical protein